jgi:queuine tRNA-ribosyltransferase/7-cyano-7-deazaguanine tRNA-ribosyltransferase
MTDSGGFQVFSLGAAKDQGVGKVLRQPHRRVPHQSTVTFSERGATITVDGKKTLLTPESSMRIQEHLGADIAFAFDECTSPLHPLVYTKQSMERTHRWALRCLNAHRKRTQLLYGIVQGGKFKSLRIKSAKTIGTMPFDGFGIGGSFGKEELANTLAWVTPHLPPERPRHLLGIGTVRDVFTAVEAGIDTMDCVIPTREARHGRIYTNRGAIDIRKTIYANGPTKKLHALFRAKNPEGGRLATLHNIQFFNTLLNRIRTSLANGTYAKLKRSMLKYY